MVVAGSPASLASIAFVLEMAPAVVIFCAQVRVLLMDLAVLCELRLSVDFSPGEARLVCLQVCFCSSSSGLVAQVG